MNESALRALLESVRVGQTSLDEAVEKLRRLPFEDIGFATVDHHREIRCGFPEVIYCPGKTPEQVVGIFSKLATGGGNPDVAEPGNSRLRVVEVDVPGAGRP